MGVDRGTCGTQKRERVGDGAPVGVGEIGKETLKSTLFKNSMMVSNVFKCDFKIQKCKRENQGILHLWDRGNEL